VSHFSKDSMLDPKYSKGILSVDAHSKNIQPLAYVMKFCWSFTLTEKSLVIYDVMNFDILVKIPFLLLMS